MPISNEDSGDTLSGLAAASTSASAAFAASSSSNAIATLGGGGPRHFRALSSFSESSQSSQSSPGPHVFQVYTFTSPVDCSQCNKPLVGTKNQGYLCKGCHMVVHEKCSDRARESGMCPKDFNSRSKLGSFTKLAAMNSFTRRQSKENISVPSDVHHNTGVSINARTLSFRNLPPAAATLAGPLIFGVPMTQQPRMGLKGYDARIPAILVILAREIKNNNGFICEGIFRQSASKSDIMAAKDAINKGRGISRAVSEDAGKNPYLYAVLIKDYFASLPIGKSLLGRLTYEQLKSFSVISLVADPKNKESLDKISNFIYGKDDILAITERSVFLWLLDLLWFAAEQSSVNLMTVDSLAIVIAPSLLEIPTSGEKAVSPQVAMEMVKLCTQLIANCLEFVVIQGGPKERDVFGLQPLRSQRYI